MLCGRTGHFSASETPRGASLQWGNLFDKLSKKNEASSAPWGRALAAQELQQAFQKPGCQQIRLERLRQNVQGFELLIGDLELSEYFQ